MIFFILNDNDITPLFYFSY